MSRRISVPHVRHFSGDGETVRIGGHLGLPPTKVSTLNRLPMSHHYFLRVRGRPLRPFGKLSPLVRSPVHSSVPRFGPREAPVGGFFRPRPLPVCSPRERVSGAIPTRKGFHLLKTDGAPAAHARPAARCPWVRCSARA